MTEKVHSYVRPTMSDSTITRRSFAAGSAMVLGSLLLPPIEGLADAFSLTPLGAQRAWAEESEGSDSAEIMVVGKTEIGIVVYDVQDPQKLKAVPNSLATLTSLFNGKKLEGTSDEAGRIIFDLKDLAEDPNAEIIGFNGSIEVTHDGYREVYIPRTRVIAHSALVAPTRPLDDKPYFRTLSFNGWDIQYLENIFISSDDADEDHTVGVELWMPKKNMSPQASLVVLEDGKETTIGKVAFEKPKDKLVQGSCSGKFLLPTSKQFIGENSTLRLRFGFKESNDSWYVDSSLQTEPTPCNENSKTKKPYVVEAQYSTSLTGLDLPSSMCSPFKGVQLSLWRPRTEFVFDVSALGFVVFGYGYNDLQLKDDGANPLKGKYNSLPIDGFKKQLANEWSMEKGVFDSYMQQGADPNDPDKTLLTTWKLVPTITISYLVQFYGKMEYSWDDDLWHAYVVGLFAFKWDALYTFRFTILGAPCFFQIHPWFEARFPISLSWFDDKLWDFNYQQDRVDAGIRLTIGLGITFGIGCEGFISTSVTAAGYLCGYMSFIPSESQHKLPWPRLTAGYGCSGVITIQLPFTKVTATIFKVDEPQALDTDDLDDKGGLSEKEKTHGNLTVDQLDPVLKERLGSFANAEFPNAGTGELPSYEELKKMAKTVTNENMLAAKEFQVVKDADYAQSPVISYLETKEGLVEGAMNNCEADEFDDTVVMLKSFAEGLDKNNSSAKQTDSSDDSDAGEQAQTANEADAGKQEEQQAAPTKDTLKSLVEHEPASNSFLAQHSYVGSMTKGGPSKELGVQSLSDSERGGVRPNVDEILFKGVYSDSRMQLLVTTNNGATFLFRIATIDAGKDKGRTRLAYHQLQSDGNWSQPWAIDYDPQIEGLSRDDMYDYEFSVTQANANGGKNYIFVIVTSNARPKGDDTDFDHNLQAHYATIVGLYDSYAAKNPLQVDPSATASLPHASEGYTLTCPRITGFSDKFAIGGTNDFCVMGTYVRRQIGGDDGISKNCRVMSYFARFELDSTYTKEQFRLSTQVINLRGQYALNDVCLLPVKIDDSDYKWEYGSVANLRRATFAYTGEEINGICKLEAHYANHDSTKFKGFVESELANVDSEKMQICKLYPWGSDGQLVATCKMQNGDEPETSGLFLMDFNPKEKGSVSFTQIGPNKGAVADFVPDGQGHYLFFVENTDGKVNQEYDKYGNVKEGGDVVEHRHRIMAVAKVDELFTEPFIFAEVDHIIDGLAATTVNDRYVSFMASTITDIDQSLTDIYDIRVPVLKCLTPLSVSCADAFAMSGEDNVFAIKLRNDGNLVATAATFTLYDEDGNKVDSKHLSFGEDMMKSARNISPDCGYNTKSLPKSLAKSKLVANDGLGVLVPGDSETYRMKFHIPEGWHDKRTVRIGISDIEVINPMDVKSSELSSYSLKLDECPEATIKFPGITLAESLDSGEVHALSKKGEEQESSSGGKGENSTDGSSANGKLMPDTSDHLPQSLLGLALGAAGASFAAYSARRNEIAASAAKPASEQPPKEEA